MQFLSNCEKAEAVHFKFSRQTDGIGSQRTTDMNVWTWRSFAVAEKTRDVSCYRCTSVYYSQTRRQCERLITVIIK